MAALLYTLLAVAASAIPISAFGFHIMRVSPSDDKPPTLWERIKKHAYMSLFLLLLIAYFLYDIDVTSITFGEVAMLLAAMSMPVALFIIATQVRDVRWGYLVMSLIVLMIPALVILTVADVVPNVATAVVGGVLFGHIITYLDTD